MAAPLSDLLQKGVHFNWKETHEKAQLELKESLMTVPILQFPIPECTYIIETDASQLGMGATLKQGDKILYYKSKKLRQVEKNYGTTELECLAVIWAVRAFREYIEGQHFIIKTDHNPLIWLFKKKDPRGKFARQIMELQNLDYIIEYKKGSENHLPDLL